MYGSIKYGTTKYGEKPSLSEEEIDLYRPNLLAYLPPILREIKEFKIIDDVVGYELGLLSWNIQDLLKQCFIDNATWGLTLWEKEYGINIDISKSYEERREVIKAQKRGHGTVSKKLIKETAEAFSGGEVKIIEHHEIYSFTAQFIGIRGIPKNLAGFKDILDNIKPAHLSYDFKYTYTIWDYLNKKKLTWTNAKAKSWNDLKVYE
ncbi:YmfQ family protein [Clostridium sp. MSJ-11]|uniref:YmfQ family protein n=1 Tax=Clostridium mobile TaxID=2841512 RepID=A0ABS6EJR3_9CLOT|nr:YmfQ family protein [Clostridium mobile]MBU5485255.1 YmfQ family protein [Clostridium mobile]